MAIKRLSEIIRKNLSIILAAFLLSCPLPLAAQFQGYFAQQTASQSLTASYPAGGTAIQTFSVNNIGQAAHQVLYNWTAAANLGSVELEGSADGTHWVVMAAGPESSNTQAFVANGYFPLVRIVVNPEQNNITAGASVTITYTGYQTPLPIPTYAEDFNPVNAAAYQQVQSGNGTQSFSNPAVLSSFICSNPNASTAWLEVISTAVAPTLGLVTPRLEVPIAANGFFYYSGPPIVGPSVWWFGAATASGGNTAVASAVHCTGTMNPFGPFAPFFLAAP